MIHQRILPFLNKNKILTRQQYGFQKNLSTMHAVLNLITATYDNIKDNTYTRILFLDLTKAFDIVCHQILLGILEHYSIRGPCLQLLNYFLKRKQFVSLDMLYQFRVTVQYFWSTSGIIAWSFTFSTLC